MQVELKANGIMKVKPENELESYALRVWWAKHNEDKGNGDEILVVDYKLEVSE